MRYKVPQNIDLEDKVIGPLTLKQFIYLLAGGMIDYIFYKSIQHWSVWLLMIIVSLIVLTFAFVKVQEQDFSYFLSSFFNFLLSPKTYVWHKQVLVEEIPKVVNPPAKEEEDKLTKDPQKIRSRLQVLAEIVDTQGWGRQEVGDRIASSQEPEKRIKKTEEKKEGIKDPLKEVEPTTTK